MPPPKSRGHSGKRGARVHHEHNYAMDDPKRLRSKFEGALEQLKKYKKLLRAERLQEEKVLNFETSLVGPEEKRPS